MDWSRIKHFKREEFDCRCGCPNCAGSGDNMAQDFVEKLDDLRNRVGFPIIVTSGYRCPAHNQRVSNTGPGGPHTTGRAVDIGVKGRRAHKILQQAVLGGWYSGIGLNQKGNHSGRFIHLDDLGPPDHPHRPNIWTY